MLAALLGVNFAVLIGILMRPEPAPSETAADQSTEATAPVETAPVATATFEDKIADAIEEKKTSPPSASPPIQAKSMATIPTIDQLRLDGSLQLAELHLDIHVYSDDPAGRFVFINMVKHREQSRIAEGPVVKEITSDGVILAYQGKTFLLPRQ
jgi:general secretion pathway protein B